MIEKLKNEYNIDDRAIFMTGMSNGALFTHYYVTRNPGVVNAIIPLHGQPVAGCSRFTSESGQTAILSVSAAWDIVIPPDGGLSDFGQIFDGWQTTMAGWARNNQCSSKPNLSTAMNPFNGGEDNLQCEEYDNCQGGRVIQCFHDAHHGNVPSSIEQLTWWFLK